MVVEIVHNIFLFLKRVSKFGRWKLEQNDVWNDLKQCDVH